MDRLPFSVYDFFGYLSAGFLVLVGVTAAFVGIEPLQQTPHLIEGVLLAVLTYIAGQVVANLSGFLIESLLVGRLIGKPTSFLFAEKKEGWQPWLFPGYCRALPKTIRTRVTERATQSEIDPSDQWGLFLHCHALAKEEPIVQERLSAFLNLYGFCRNCSLSLLIVAACLLVGICEDTAETGVVPAGWWVGAALIGAFGLFYRYLKFYRLYAAELFVTYSKDGASTS